MKATAKLLGICVVVALPLAADTITAGSGASWVSFGSTGFSSGQPNPAMGSQGTPFWDNWSWDASSELNGVATVPCSSNCSHDMNIGYELTDSGGWAQTGTPGVLGTDSVANALLGCTGGGDCTNNDPTSFVFNVTSGSKYQISLLDAMSNNNGPDGTVFGWYNVATGQLFPLYSSVGYVVSPEAWQAFSTGLASGAQYGFYATVCYNMAAVQNGSLPNCSGDTETFYTNSLLDTGVLPGSANYNHFALFNLTSSANNYVIAFKDGSGAGGPEGMGDFNDLVFELELVPEPATLTLVGASLLGLGLLRRRAIS